MKKLTPFLLFAHLLLCFSLFAEEAPEEYTPAEQKAILYHFPGEADNIQFVDTLLDNIEFYDPVNQAGNFSMHTGNVGGPALFFEHFEMPEFGFTFAPSTFGHWERKLENLKVYQNTFPYTKMHLLFGMSQRVMARGVHSQPIGRGIHISGDFQRINAGGGYVRQRNLNNHLALHLNYISPQGNYVADIAYFFNNHRGQENGGFQEVDYLENNQGVNLDLVPMRFSNAERTNSINTLFIRQEWKFAKTQITPPVQENDTTENNMVVDTAEVVNDTILAPVELSPFSIYHQFEHSTYKFLFRDNNPDANFYPDYFELPADSVFREDRSREISQRLGFKGEILLAGQTDTNSIPASIYYDFHAGGRIIDNQLLFFSEDYLQFETSAAVGFKNRFVRGEIKGKRILGGYNDGENLAEASVNTTLPGDFSFGFQYKYQKGEAPYIYRKMQSNVHSYENHLPDYRINHIKVNATWLPANLKLSLKATHLDNYFYFSDRAVAAYVDGNFWDMSASLSHQIEFGRFGFKNHLTFRYLTDNTAYDVPAFNFLHTIYYENKLFDEALMFRLGLNIRHFSSYEVQGYDPLTNSFYRQTDWKPDYHPVADLFLNVKIQTVRVSASFTHLNARLYPSETAWAAYRYPVANRSFQIGINWMFYN